MIAQLLKVPPIPRFCSNHLGLSLQVTLSRLVDLDLQFGCKLKMLMDSPLPEDAKDQLAQRLREIHRQEREPLVERLAELHAQTLFSLGLRA
jgi:hypothetical protein